MFNKKPSEACSKKIREEHQPNILVVYNMIDIFTLKKNMTSNRINDPKMFEHHLTYGDVLTVSSKNISTQLGPTDHSQKETMMNQRKSFINCCPRDPITETENGFMESKYLAFRR